MSPRRAARAALVCTLVLGVLTSAAQPPNRRPVAVIELSGTSANQALASTINAELNTNNDLRPLDGSTQYWMYGVVLKEEGADQLEAALRDKQEAETKVGSYDFATAATRAAAGIEALALVPASPRVFALSAELAFILGTARLGDRKPKEAADAFRLAHALDAAFKPDAIRYVPEVIQAYQAALQVTPPLGKIDVAGTGRAFIDGKEVGVAPAWFDAPAGTHVVWLVDPDRLPRAKQVVVVAGRKERLEFDDTKASLEVKAQRARYALKTAPDATARAAAMLQLSALLEVKDAVLLNSQNDKTVFQTWTEKDGFAAHYERKGETPIEILKPLLPEKPPEQPKDPPPKVTKPVVVDTRPWWQKPKYQIAGGTVAAVILGAIVIGLKTWERDIGIDTDPGFQTRDR